MTTIVALQAMVQQYEEMSEMTILLPPGPVTLEVEEFDPWAPGQRFVEAEAPDGTWYKVADITARSFVGKVQGDDSSSVHITLDPPAGSAVGYIVTGGRGYTVEPKLVVPGQPAVPAEIAWNDLLARPLPVPHDQHSTPCAEGMICTADASYTEKMQVKPHVDNAFKSIRSSDYTTMVSQSLSIGHSMYDYYTVIHLEAQSIREVGTSWTATGCDTVGNSFISWLSTRTLSGVDTYPLYIGHDVTLGGFDAQGCAIPERLGNSEAVSVNEAVDVSSTDDYYPYNGRHLGLVVNQEIGHNAGEPDHPMDQACGEYKLGVCTTWWYNVMSSGPYSQTEFFFTSTSEARIETFAYPRL